MQLGIQNPQLTVKNSICNLPTELIVIEVNIQTLLRCKVVSISLYVLASLTI